ncbi:hypothetical protein [Paenibacillus graminis]|uniref:hypothetical protein n=1 Tax=Paenibacillus graminis TaxID=189425 RepID=UPI002DBFC758|nr:hypothetical protein [Paenibacillus graminis]MEC0169941.1 hypothetical protein [Paenibacillus graminis]
MPKLTRGYGPTNLQPEGFNLGGSIMLNEMSVSDSEKKMLEAMRECGITPHNMVEMARSHAIKIKSWQLRNYDKIVEAISQ